jgi:hypothetical protein
MRLILSARPVIDMPEVGDQEFVALQLCHDVEEDTLRVSLIVRVDVQVEAVTPCTHVLTCVTQRVDNLFPGDGPGDADLGDTGLRGLTICDPGGLLRLSDDQFLEVVIEGLVEWRGAVSEIFGEEED